MYTLIENIRIISPDLDIANGSLLIKDDLIVNVAPGRISTPAGAKVIDGMTLMPHLPCMMADVLHPNALGFSLYAKALVQALCDQ